MTTACMPCAPRAGRAASRGLSTTTATATGTATTRYPAWRTPPERPALAWAAAAVGPGARVRSVRPLGGGIAGATDALTIDDVTGTRHRLVLQRWIRPGWETDDPGFDPAKEAAVLTALELTVIPAPRLVAVDRDGSQADVPALLTERLPGRQPTLREIARPGTLAALGSMLAQIHRVGAVLADDPTLRAVVLPYDPFGDLAAAVIPTATRRPDLWQAALDVAGSVPAMPATPTLIHRDYHAWNTLWLDGRLTGIVDWTSTSWGPPAADLAHLRVDLVVDVSFEAAVLARAAFANAGGDLTNARHHQMRTVFDYLTDNDPASFDDAVVGRLDAFLERVLSEPDGPARGA